MAEKEIPPHRCTYCLHALPEDKHQDIFAAESLRPQSDDAENFVTEAQRILRYTAAVATMCNDAKKIDEDIVYELQSLVRELADEAYRRLDRAQDALEIVWEREQAARKASQARKEGA